MLSKRIIACLDVRDGVVVKGVRFRDHETIGDPVALARRYRDEGADEIVLYDIKASTVDDRVRLDLVNRLAQALDIPFCVAGGIRSVAQAQAILAAGADKISINTPALMRPELITELAEAIGVQCVVVGVDVTPPWVYSHTGDVNTTRSTGRLAREWIAEAVQRGAGEIVVNCMQRDGTKAGFDVDFLAEIRPVCTVPLVASGGAGLAEHFAAVFAGADVDAALAAGALHRQEISIHDIKKAVAANGHEVRWL